MTRKEFLRALFIAPFALLFKPKPMRPRWIGSHDHRMELQRLMNLHMSAQAEHLLFHPDCFSWQSPPNS